MAVNEIGDSNEDDRQGGYYGVRQDQSPDTQNADGSGRGKCQSHCCTDTYSQRGFHRSQASVGAAAFFAFFGDFSVAFGAIGGATESIAGSGKLTSAWTKA